MMFVISSVFLFIILFSFNKDTIIGMVIPHGPRPIDTFPVGFNLHGKSEIPRFQYSYFIVSRYFYCQRRLNVISIRAPVKHFFYP